MFNPDTFMSTETTDANATTYEPVPEGEFQAVIDSVQPRVTPKGTPLLEVTWQIDAPGIEAAHERKVRQTIWLDVTESGGLATGKGKNVQLGRLREAVGQNTPGQPWSPSMLLGNVASVTVKHRFSEDGSEIYTDVKGVTKV